MMQIQFTSLPQAFEPCSAIVCRYLNLECAPSGIPVTVRDYGEGILLARRETGWLLQCGTISAFSRALGLLVDFFERPVGFRYQETPKFQSLGVMLDCARNAVMTVEAVKDMLVQLSVMGYSTAQLYLEDVFALEDYPYFGYMRGRYSRDELRQIDAFASDVGIEMIPCIQTLAHLPRAFHWCELDEVVDCGDILLCGEEKTYGLIDAMFRTMRACFRSDRINIGMDEAHMLGLGKYLDRNGYQNRFDIMLKHLGRVVEIARKYHYQPMMWSDMFFRLANGGEYYPAQCHITKEVCDKIPEEIALIYWDYYHEDEAVYRRMLQAHKKFGRRIYFAAGAWKWVGFTPQNQFSMRIAGPAARACAASGVTDVFVTCWGDNGAEASAFSVLPTLSCWAELCWADAGEAWRSRRFETCCQISYQDFMQIDAPGLTPDHPTGEMGVNPTKYLLYQDILFGFADSCGPDAAFAKHFAACAEALEQVQCRAVAQKEMFAAQAALCRVLEVKAPLGAALRRAYHAQDRAEMERLWAQALPELLPRIKAFQKAYHLQWLAENKPFGLEVFDIRTGGLSRRVEVAMERVRAYLDGEIRCIPELEAPLLPFAPSKHKANPFQCVLWETVATANGLVWM